ncbi:LysR family transcriptional regulator [Asticcacaulis sp. SL142]|uniref:LysR family transcriptional regulator n=1 Tax=Asticcacaulis sp. SL142 TaxID=2995155 RepID=UPI00226CB5C3|nr:LysR family transcriptional regulator [Asticcacaulis sp. SL142]WAC48032.1 LysR family transcriptional regulator [Asticcacaulis sp. SL142]
MDISWDIYRTFLSVLTEGSLSGAARALGLAQPTVGRHMDALEDAVGYQLFTRSQHGLTPTEAARTLEPYAVAMLSSAAALKRAASAQGDTLSGTVRISASEIIGVRVLPPILSDLHHRHQDIAIELSLSNAPADMLRRDADIAVRMFEPKQEALVVQKVGIITLGLYARADYLERYGTPLTARDLRDHSTVGYDTETAAIRAMKQRLPDLDIDFTFRSDSDVAQLSMIEAGFGIGFCQTGLAYHSGLVRVVPGLTLTLPTYVVMHENLKSTPRCRVMFDALVDGLKTYAANS